VREAFLAFLRGNESGDENTDASDDESTAPSIFSERARVAPPLSIASLHASCLSGGLCACAIAD
jgi:hypothetical protein